MVFAETLNRLEALIVMIVSFASIGFFGLCGIYGLIKLFDNKPGLIINEQGILDNSSAVSGNLIKWEDITGFEIEQVKSTKFLLIFVKNPEFYLERVNMFKRFWMSSNEKFYGTPLSISSNSLKCNFDELITIIGQKLDHTDAH